MCLRWGHVGTQAGLLASPGTCKLQQRAAAGLQCSEDLDEAPLRRHHAAGVFN